MIALGGFLAGVGVSAFNPVWETVLQRRMRRTSLSRVTAYDWLVSTALSPVGQMLAGPVAIGIGVDPTLWVVSAFFVAGTGAVLAVPSIRALEA